MNTPNLRFSKSIVAACGFVWLVVTVLLDKHMLLLKGVSSITLMVLMIALFIVQFQKLIQRQKHYIFGAVIVLSIVAYLLLFYRISDDFWEYKRQMFLILSQIPGFSLMVLYTITGEFDSSLGPVYIQKRRLVDIGGILSLLLLVGLITFYSPVTIHLSDPESLPFSLTSLLLWHALYFVLGTGAGLLFYFSVSNSLRMILSPLTVVVATGAWIYTYLFPGDYGLLDVVLFSEPGNLMGVDRLFDWSDRILQLTEAMAILIGGGLLFFITIKKIEKIVPLLVILNLMTFGQTLFNVISTPEAWSAGQQSGSAYLPSTSEKLFRFSTEENVLVFMLDMFNGGLIPELFEEHPELDGAFDGFVWYPNTISLGMATFAGLPGILGGEEYSPHGVAELPGIPMTERLRQAYSFYPKLFTPRGFDFTYVNPVYFNLAEIGDELGITVVEPDSFTEYWMNRTDEARTLDLNMTPMVYSRLFSVIGLFKASPHFLRPYIYLEGRWLNLNRGDLETRHALIHLAMLDLFGRLGRVEGSAPVFKFIDSELTHTPWALDDSLNFSTDSQGRLKSYQGTQGPKNAAARALIELAQLFSLLQQEGVWDQTKIVLVSDHGSYRPDPMWKDIPDIVAEDGTILKESGSVHGLLMVKDFGSRGILKSDPRLMSTADTAEIVRAALPGYADQDPTKEIDTDREVFVSFTPVPPEENASDSYIINYQFAVRGNPADWNNWRQTIP